ncbi:Hcp family type VI secretion system effector [Scandinavium manionii]|uniref:Hcp family type VI secretion system effector n=1 Tax=Scandinavium manionii TaxID=2926520 RepID=UPI00216680B3|nr:Hcp family type VI secretion system effector [Scandinavium manionii]MCS2147155.1 Hcp family type VI secretion system effector [Scandinavium manionii]
MAGLTYLTINGKRQGLISEGCLTQSSLGNKALIAHQNQIFIFSLSHSLSREQNVNHHNLTIIKPVDKASPLLANAISENESLSCEFEFYRTAKAGCMERYYLIKLTEARVADFHLHIPHNVHHNGEEPQESVSFSYRSITWEHCIAGTSAYSIWDDRVF